MRTTNAFTMEKEYANDSSISEAEKLNIPTLVLSYQFKAPAFSCLDNKADYSFSSDENDEDTAMNEPVRKKRLSPTCKARRETSRSKFVEKGGMPDRVKSFREINNREDCPKARHGFIKPIRDGLKTKKFDLE